MKPIRYQQRICSDQDKIQRFMEETRTGVIGMQGTDYPYSVPVNFVWHDKMVYIHGMGSGKKEEILQEESLVCFTVFQEYGTVMDPMPCHADTSYMSVMLFGTARKVTNYEQAAFVLQKLVEKYMPDYYLQKLTGSLMEKYRSAMDGKAVSVYEIKPDYLTAKENCVEENQIFHHSLD